ncbi:helix-turn-helix domain-containing protein [Bradyrhizobium erythrophlei]|uniref:helix-turn-helix domain-containing protein n=1 Tax=Bradyrhizobium erythrophlei TaxID=1437360 RepID=UPI0035EA5C75
MATLSETGCAMASQAKLIGWGARVLYLGPAFGLTPHRNATAVLAIGLDHSFDVADDPEREDGVFRSARSVLIPPNTLHHLRISRGRMAFLYLDPLSRDLAAITSRMRETTPRAAFGLAGEGAAIGILRDLADGHLAPGDARQGLDALLGIGVSAKADRRIAAALQRMRDEPFRSHSLTQLGTVAGLSPSRFLHLFKAETGVPLRRYRLWSRMGAAVNAVRQGMSLTEAAHAAGFASSAHFSGTFRDMFGMMPSEFLRRLEPHAAPLSHTSVSTEV